MTFSIATRVIVLSFDLVLIGACAVIADELHDEAEGSDQRHPDQQFDGQAHGSALLRLIDQRPDKNM